MRAVAPYYLQMSVEFDIGKEENSWARGLRVMQRYLAVPAGSCRRVLTWRGGGKNCRPRARRPAIFLAAERRRANDVALPFDCSPNGTRRTTPAPIALSRGGGLPGVDGIRSKAEVRHRPGALHGLLSLPPLLPSLLQPLPPIHSMTPTPTIIDLNHPEYSRCQGSIRTTLAWTSTYLSTVSGTELRRDGNGRRALRTTGRERADKGGRTDNHGSLSRSERG